MDSPEMEEMLANPELLKATIKNNPLINAIPGASEQVEALLQSDAFNDPAQLKQAMRQGVDAMKAVGSEFGSQLGAQMKLAQQNPEAFKAQMEAMMSQLAGGHLSVYVPSQHTSAAAHESPFTASASCVTASNEERVPYSALLLHAGRLKPKPSQVAPRGQQQLKQLFVNG